MDGPSVALLSPTYDSLINQERRSTRGAGAGHIPFLVVDEEVTDEPALLAAIAAAPDDNTARLVYADWLDEHGTTDQQAARSEWIRRTCWDRGRRSLQPTGRRSRLPGEPAWVRANVHRLWPNLWELGWQTDSTPGIGLQTGCVTLSMYVPDADGAPDPVPCGIVITAERGVTTAVAFALLRAARIAPLAATDEPLAALKLIRFPSNAYRRLSEEKRYAIRRRPFELRHLTGVWDLFPGDVRGAGADTQKTRPAFDDLSRNVEEASELLNEALTVWGRTRAANPT